MALDKTNSELRAALASLEDHLGAERNDKNIPGLSAAVVCDQEVIWAKGFGYANLEERIPADPQTIYRIGSITKLFTATMLMQLRDGGELQLDDPIDRYLPAFKIKSRFNDPRPATFRQLASHTAGLPRETPINQWERAKPLSIEEVLDSLKNAELIFASMTKFKYSNLGYAILGHVLECVANQPYKQYVVAHILQPLEMNNSGFDLTDELKERAAVGYVFSGNETTKTDSHLEMGAIAPAGQLYSTVEDMSRFISLQFRDGPAGAKQILGGTTLREMRSPVLVNPDWQEGIAIGWRLRPLCNRTAIGHGGDVPGFNAGITLLPDIKLGFSVFTNTNFITTADAYNISRSALELLAPIVSRVLARQQVALSMGTPADWHKYTGRYRLGGIAEIEVKVVEGKLLLTLPGAPPGSEVILTQESEHRFRMEGGPADGELAVFELDADGNVTGVKASSYSLERIISGRRTWAATAFTALLRLKSKLSRGNW